MLLPNGRKNKAIASTDRKPQRKTQPNEWTNEKSQHRKSQKQRKIKQPKIHNNKTIKAENNQSPKCFEFDNVGGSGEWLKKMLINIFFFFWYWFDYRGWFRVCKCIGKGWAPWSECVGLTRNRTASAVRATANGQKQKTERGHQAKDNRTTNGKYIPLQIPSMQCINQLKKIWKEFHLIITIIYDKFFIFARRFFCNFFFQNLLFSLVFFFVFVIRLFASSQHIFFCPEQNTQFIVTYESILWTKHHCARFQWTLSILLVDLIVCASMCDCERGDSHLRAK